MGDIRIVKLTNTDPEFYPLIGPFLGQRSVIAQVGGPLYDDANKVWFVALMNDRVVGFAAILPMDKKARFCSDYIPSEYRNQGVPDRLMVERLEHAARDAQIATATVSKADWPVYERHGFHVMEKSGKLKKFAQMERTLP